MGLPVAKGGAYSVSRLARDAVAARSTRSLLGWLSLGLLAAGPALGQNAGSLRGTVTDPSGGAVPAAKVVLTNEATHFVRQVVADAKGGYVFTAVDPGRYTVQVVADGFKTDETRGLRMSPNDTQGLDVTLEVGERSESIEVAGDRTMLHAQTGAREGLITAEQIENISMIGRNPMELMRLLPGVVTPDQGEMETVGKFSGALDTNSYGVNGIRGQNMMITLDGSKLTDVGCNCGALIVPNNDMVAEVKIQSSNYAAEFGSSGVQVQAVTKAGSSDFHGTAYDYARNHKLAANDRSRNYAGLGRPESNFQYPGFNVSGPILIPGTGFNKNRDKAFFFLGFELSRQSLDQGVSFAVTPTLGQRQGLFDDYLTGQHLNQPTRVNIPSGFPGAGTPAPNNDLRPYIDPTGLKLIDLYPLPNYTDPDNRYNYVNGRLIDQNRNEAVLRVDYNVSESTRAYVRLARDSEVNVNPRGLWWNSSDVALPSAVKGPSLGRTLAANVTSVLSPSLTNEVLFTWSQNKIDNVFVEPSKMRRDTYGITEAQNPFGPVSPYVPGFAMVGPEANLWAGNDVEDIFAYNSFWAVSDGLTKVMNAHAVRLGVTVERQDKTQNFNNSSNVAFTFAPRAYGTTGSNFGDLLVGRPDNATLGTPAADGVFVAWNIEAYVQDSWKVTKHLTLEYGLRVGKWTNNEEVNGLGAIFLPSRYNPSAGRFTDTQNKRLNGLAYVATGDVPPGLTAPRPPLFMPRVNFAWDVSGDGRTVVRGGGGVFYNRETGNAQYGVIQVPPNAYNATVDSYTQAGLGGGQGLTYSTLGQVDPYSQLSSFNLYSVSPTSLEWPRTFSTSLSVSRRLPWHQVIEAGYVGTFGRHLASSRFANPIPPGDLSSGVIGNSDLSIPANRLALDRSVVDARRPFPALGGNVHYNDFAGNSNYHSLQATLSRQAGNLQYLLAYTLSKSLGTMGGDMGLIDPFDPSVTYGILPTDRTHLLNVSWTWQLGAPVKKGRLAKGLLNDWHLSGVSTFSSGTPVRLGFTGDLGNAGIAWWGTPDHIGGAITPTFACDPRRGGNNVGDRIFDIRCVGIPAFGQSGPFQSPYYLKTPSRIYHDLTVFKDFKIGRGAKKLQFRTGFFNVFNQASADDIDLNLEAHCRVKVDGVPNGLGGTNDGQCDPAQGYEYTANTLQNFGKIITKHGHRVIELALKFYF